MKKILLQPVVGLKMKIKAGLAFEKMAKKANEMSVKAKQSRGKVVIISLKVERPCFV